MAKSSSPARYALGVKDILDPGFSNQTHLSHCSTWPFSVGKTDPEGWRLIVQEAQGRLIWKYLRTEEERNTLPQDAPSRYFLGLPTVRHYHPSDSLVKKMLTEKQYAPAQKAAKRPSEALNNATRFHGRLQISQLGCWVADMSCILFVTPMLVFAWYITEANISEAHVLEIANYLLTTQNIGDGGWPTHLEGETTLLGTVLVYVALRLMGVDAGHQQLRKAREYILGIGGAVYLPAWGKFWLCLLGLYEWEGTDPYPAELWLLPPWVPVSPWKWAPLVRQVVLGMSYLGSRKFTIPSNPLITQIREEIFTETYSSINFASFNNTVANCERQQQKSWILKALNWGLVNIWKPWFRPESMVARAEAKAFELISLSSKSLQSTGMLCVDQFLNMISHYAREGAGSSNVREHQEVSMEYLWPNSQGVQVTSIHGGQTWETSLVLGTMASAGLARKPETEKVMKKAYGFLADQQLLEDWHDNPPCFRFSRAGGWPFSAGYQGGPCSDCTGEALKAILSVEAKTDIPRKTSKESIRLAADNLLRNQNPSGGYSSFEPIRGSSLLEYLNGTELFGRVMVEYDYVECTGSCITALVLFRSMDKEYRTQDVDLAIYRGVQFIHQSQRSDGSWQGYWGICFTYAAMFALETLSATGETYENSPTVQRACHFLLRQQKTDGGWGETVDSIIKQAYSNADCSDTVQTAWVCLALLYAEYPDQAPIERGVRLIMSRQRIDGEWIQERRVGSGILTCTLLYHNYVFTFAMRALATFMERYGDREIL